MSSPPLNEEEWLICEDPARLLGGILGPPSQRKLRLFACACCQRVEVLEGIGFIPRDPDPEKRQIYSIADSDLCLIATAEITLGGMHRDHIFDELDLPKKYVGLSHCFRTEAGAPGKDTRGLYRVHQFTKVEMFAFCLP